MVCIRPQMCTVISLPFCDSMLEICDLNPQWVPLALWFRLSLSKIRQSLRINYWLYWNTLISFLPRWNPIWLLLFYHEIESQKWVSISIQKSLQKHIVCIISSHNILPSIQYLYRLCRFHTRPITGWRVLLQRTTSVTSIVWVIDKSTCVPCIRTCVSHRHLTPWITKTHAHIFTWFHVLFTRYFTRDIFTRSKNVMFQHTPAITTRRGRQWKNSNLAHQE